MEASEGRTWGVVPTMDRRQTNTKGGGGGKKVNSSEKEFSPIALKKNTTSILSCEEYLRCGVLSKMGGRKRRGENSHYGGRKTKEGSREGDEMQDKKICGSEGE